MPRVTRIDHIAVVVNDMEASVRFWQDALGLELAGRQVVPAEQAEIAFLPAGSSEIELVRPTSTDSGLARYLEKRGPGMHHICLEVDDIEGMLAQLKDKGVELINETPREGQDGRKYAFIHPRSAFGVMVELYQYSRREGGESGG